MNKDRRNFKKVLAAICAFSGTFGGNGASAAQKNKKVTTVKTDVKSNVKSKNLSLNRQSGNKNFFRKTWNLIKAHPLAASGITIASLAALIGVPVVIAKSIKGKKDDKKLEAPSSDKGKGMKDINKGKENLGEGEGEGENKKEDKDRGKNEGKENQEKNNENQENQENKGEIKEGNQQPQQPKDNFKLHFDNLKVNDKEPDLMVNDVWNVLKNYKILTGNPNVKFYKIEENRYAVMVRKGTDEENKLLNISAKDLTSNNEVLSDFKVFCITKTSDGFFSGSSLKFVGPSDFLSFESFSSKQNNLTVKKK